MPPGGGSSYCLKYPGGGGGGLLLLLVPLELCLWVLFLADRGASLDSGF